MGLGRRSWETPRPQRCVAFAIIGQMIGNVLRCRRHPRSDSSRMTPLPRRQIFSVTHPKGKQGRVEGRGGEKGPRKGGNARRGGQQEEGKNSTGGRPNTIMRAKQATIRRNGPDDESEDCMIVFVCHQARVLQCFCLICRSDARQSPAERKGTTVNQKQANATKRNQGFA